MQIEDSRPHKRVGNLIIYDNGTNGLSWKRFYTDRDGKEKYERCDYEGINGDDMMDYQMSELLPYNFDTIFTKEEQELFVSEFARIKQNARHRNCYNANENEWKDYD